MADKSYKLTLSLSDGSIINAGIITAPQGPTGANGVTFTPSVSAAGVLSWTNNGGLTNPPSVNIKGPKGDDAVITESDVAGWGFTKNAGTITGIKMNGVSKGTSRVVDLGTVLTDASVFATSAQGTKADNAMPKSGGTFTGEVKFGNTENFQGYYIKRMIGYLGAGTAYANLSSSYRDGTWHRMWRLRFPSGSSFWGKIKITLYGGYSSFNASGVMSKSITCNFNTSSIYNNVGCYDGLGVNVEQDFRISEAIWNATASAWEVLIWQKNLSGNNSPAIMLECWTTNNTNYINAFNGITAQTVELTQSTSYSAQKASPTGGTKTVMWAVLPVYENPLGEKIATVGDLSGKANLVGGNTFTGAQIVRGEQLTIMGNDNKDEDYLLDIYDEDGTSATLFGVYRTSANRATVKIGDGDSAVDLSVGNSTGTSGQVLTSQGAGKTPAWQDIQVPAKASLSVPNAKVPMTGKWVSKTWGGNNAFAGSLDIWTDGDYIYTSNGTSHYKLDKATSTWYSTSWKGLTSFLGEYVWTDGDNIYYSNGDAQYVLNKSTSTWSTKTWKGLTNFKGTNVWTDGDNIYYSNKTSEQYVLNKTTSTWVVKSWKGFTNVQGDYVWTDGDNIYHSTSSAHYVLDVTTSTWHSKTWNGTNSNLVRGTLIWTDGDNIYCSNSTSTQLQLVKSTIANKTSVNSDIKNIYTPITKIIDSGGTHVADSSGRVTLASDSVASVVSLTSELTGGAAYTVFGDGEKGSFIGIIDCEYNTSVGDFEFEINDNILTFTPTSDWVTLRVTIDRMYNGSVWTYYYTIVASDKSIDHSGFFTDTYSTMYISTNLSSSYYQGGVGVIIKKAV